MPSNIRRIVIGGRPFDVPIDSSGGLPAYRLFRTQGGVRPQAARPAPRRRGFGALGGSTERQNEIPMPDGSEGSGVWPYEETPPTWNTGGMADTLPGSPALIGGVPSLSPQTQPGYLPTSVPYGITDPQSQVKWRNPTTASLVPILASTPSNVPVLQLNYQRNLLIIQNNSTATSPDTTPTFFLNFNTPVPGPGLGLGLIAGVGIVFDIICPRDAVYVTQVGGAGASLVVAGAVIQGTFAPG